jgi:hypothetical protein
LRLKCDELLSNFAFNFKLRRFTMAVDLGRRNVVEPMLEAGAYTPPLFGST